MNGFTIAIAALPIGIFVRCHVSYKRHHEPTRSDENLMRCLPKLFKFVWLLQTKRRIMLNVSDENGSVIDVVLIQKPTRHSDFRHDLSQLGVGILPKPRSAHFVARCCRVEFVPIPPAHRAQTSCMG